MLVLLDDGNGAPVAASAGAWDRLLVRLRGFRLDAALAGGASPDASVALAVRAEMLEQVQARRDLARSAQRIVIAATHGPAAGRLAVPVCRDRVRDCAQEFSELISGLLAAGPVSAAGVAQARVLLSDARSPLYRRSSADDLRAQVRRVTDALSAI